MPTIVDGNSLGLAGSTMNTLGLPPGTAAVGRSGDSLYVNAATGNLILQRQDELLLGRGPDIAALRTYNSQGASDGDDNDNWRIGFYRQLTALTGTVNKNGSTITRVDADGAELLYHYDSERSRYLCEQGAGAYDTLRYDAVTRLWLWADGASDRSETYQWNAAAGLRQLISERDADGNALQYSYDSRGLLNRVTSADGDAGRLNQTELIYEAKSARTSKLLSIQSSAWDAASNSNRILTRVRYAYDACDRLSMVSVDLSPQDNSIADGNTYVTRYTYDGDSQRIASLAQTDGTLLRFDYACVDGDYRVASVVNALGQVTRYQYDTQKRTTTVIDPSGFKTRHDYDSAGRLIRLTAPAVDSVLQVQQFRYNERGDLTQRIDAKGQVTDIAYDRNGNQVLQRDAAGNTITRYYGAENQLLAETVYAVPDADGAGPARPSTAQTTHYVYAAAQSRQLRFIVSPEGRVTEYRYNAAGERISQIQYTRDLADTRGWLLAFPAALPALPSSSMPVAKTLVCTPGPKALTWAPLRSKKVSTMRCSPASRCSVTLCVRAVCRPSLSIASRPSTKSCEPSSERV
jgi:YD repeat-containing protein